MSEKINNYVDHLIKIGRKSIDDMTYFEKHHFAGLILQREKSEKQAEIFSEYLITDNEEDAKKVLKLIKDIAIDHNIDVISDLLANKIKQEDITEKELI